LRQLRQESIPDDEGRLLTALSGTLSLSGSNGVHSKLAFDKLIHSADTSEYVGLLANLCNYVLGINMIFNDTSDPYTFQAVIDAQWSDGSLTEEPANLLTSGNTNLATTNGSLATVHPFDNNSHTVSFSTEVVETSCDICSSDDFFASAELQVPPRPPCSEASVSLSGLTPILLEKGFPNLKTGIGAVAAMLVSPVQVDWTNTVIVEAVSLLQSTCPSPPAGITFCSGNSAFTVSASQPSQFGSNFPSATNIFYDFHLTEIAMSFLDTSGTNQSSCQVQCTQSYSCGGKVIGNFVITRNFSKDQIQGTPVTRVDVKKDPD
jgi:hypothetical protein